MYDIILSYFLKLFLITVSECQVNILNFSQSSCVFCDYFYTFFMNLSDCQTQLNQVLVTTPSTNTPNLTEKAW